jgi:alpha-beta hydrolase superfamily lysophospholipase
LDLNAVQPFYLETESATVLALYHAAPVAMQSGLGVLICSPWGWDEVASYRSRRRWAERLADEGHPTLRFDLPAVGDSSGAPTDSGLLDAWVDAVGAGVAALRASGCVRVAALGLGAGGLLAREAASRGAAIDEIILWGAPTTGKAMVREIRAFSRLQGWSEDAGEQGPLPPGALEAGGFVLSAETLADLRTLAPKPGPTLRRCLLLGRDGVAIDEGLQRELSEGGIAVETASGSGWALLVSHPERSRLDPDTADRVAAWLRVGADERVSGNRVAGGTSLVTDVEGVAVRETPRIAECDLGNFFGVFAEPVHGSNGDTCAIFLNAGAVRHTGPNRLWVETARRWAAKGTPSLRLDLEGVGETDGDETHFTDVAQFYIPKFERGLISVLDSLEAEGVAARFLLVGLCSGGFWSFRAAAHDSRIISAVLLNAGALVWQDDILERREGRKLDRIFQRSWWRRFDRSAVQKPTAARVLGLVKAKARSWAGAGRKGTGTQEAIEAGLDEIRDLGTRLVVAFSAGEPLHAELAAEGLLDRLGRWPDVQLEDLPDSDHTLRPLAAQAAAARLLDREREIAVEMQGAGAT